MDHCWCRDRSISIINFVWHSSRRYAVSLWTTDSSTNLLNRVSFYRNDLCRLLAFYPTLHSAIFKSKFTKIHFHSSITCIISPSLLAKQTSKAELDYNCCTYHVSNEKDLSIGITFGCSDVWKQVQTKCVLSLLNGFRCQTLPGCRIHSISNINQRISLGFALLRKQQRRSKHFHHLLVLRVLQIVEDSLHHDHILFNSKCFEQHENWNVIVDEFAATEELVISFSELQLQCELWLHCIRFFFNWTNLITRRRKGIIMHWNKNNWLLIHREIRIRVIYLCCCCFLFLFLTSAIQGILGSFC